MFKHLSRKRQITATMRQCATQYIGLRSAVSSRTKLQRQIGHHELSDLTGKKYDVPLSKTGIFYVYKNVVVPESERRGIFRRDGTIEFVDGPASRRVICQRVFDVARVTATESEYLAIKHKDGITEHKSGPISIWLSPIKYQSIKVIDKTELKVGEAVVAYTNSSDNDIQREVIKGPRKFYLKPNQWLHNFSWTDDDNTLEFKKLQTANAIEIHLEGLRTKCNVTLSELSLSVSFHIDDIDLMLEKAQNPVAHFTSAISADLLKFVGNLTISEFKTNSDKLNSLDSFPITRERAREIGFSLQAADFCGYSISSSIQRLLDEEIQASISREIQKHNVEQEQAVLDIKLKKEGARQEEEMRLHRVRHESELEQIAKREQVLNETSLERVKALNNAKLDYYKKLKEIGVDLTSILVAENQGNFTKEFMCSGKKE